MSSAGRDGEGFTISSQCRLVEKYSPRLQAAIMAWDEFAAAIPGAFSWSSGYWTVHPVHASQGIVDREGLDQYPRTIEYLNCFFVIAGQDVMGRNRSTPQWNVFIAGQLLSEISAAANEPQALLHVVHDMRMPALHKSGAECRA